ncbi:MAG: hypothetical protein ACLUEM_01970 [Oscillospiraceae bacterium]
MAEQFRQFISKDALDLLSYRSTLGQSLKQIHLSRTPIEVILEDIAKYRESYIETFVQENLIGSRFKSDDSILRKHEKVLRTGGGFKQCFNDVLGFRLKFDEYPTEFPDYFRVVDLRQGKQVDDGYRAIHLYYQRDSWSYPIEVQLWCGRDFCFNIWSHQYAYKYSSESIGLHMRELFDAGDIQTEQAFKNKLKELTSRDGR